MTPDDHVRHSTEHAGYGIQVDLAAVHPAASDSRRFCLCGLCLGGAYVHPKDEQLDDDRNEYYITNDKCIHCGHPTDYCHRHPCGGRPQPQLTPKAVCDWCGRPQADCAADLCGWLAGGLDREGI